MSDLDFFEFAFSNIPILLFCMFVTTGILYLSVRRFVFLGYLDPLHFYWTFTFGTAYGIVLALFVGGYISIYYVVLLLSYAVVFLMFLRFSAHHGQWLHKLVVALLVPGGRGRGEFWLILLLYICLALFLIANTGFGSSAETNRFEQNRGLGAFVRVADAFRLFLVASIAVVCVERWRQGKRNYLTLLLGGGYFLLLLISSLLNGAKFAILEGIYASIFALAVQGYRLRLSFLKVGILFSVVLIFAIWILGKNLQGAGVDAEAPGVYMQGTPVIYERLVLRVLANADKYYLSLPNGVIEELKADRVLVQFIAPLISVTKMSEIVGYPINDYAVGRQALLYWYPDYSVAGGPTSHFDLFSYKYFGFLPGLLFAAFVGWFLASIAALARLGRNRGPFYAALCGALWVRSIAMLLEPTVGLAYVLDIFLLFFVMNFIGVILRLASRGNVRVVN
ncbi:MULTISPECIES: hypothetical protein [Pseudomonas]|uniref:Oligosaccharide repeat unit polymerase n=1 Tax=Pseudomonas plecoglossicida TaxID=70775 RepID=A0ABX4TTP7_PSEDL|nr:MULTISPECIES: hypothetical protein [Pseudomonas]PLU84359.1 hypothetical protein CXG44_26560 [Pseudomonas plecoglossicida]PLU89625.1 hypothetical protein CXG45_26960 [Pseudomonas plecoglossicida]PLU97680.1 hypothetical protein CXG48_26925 [Pseudomonas plecoglossicida]PLV07726.1 hypothetical protein CXG47_27100 [Pseudomonas plecoglossicida]